MFANLCQLYLLKKVIGRSIEKKNTLCNMYMNINHEQINKA